MAKGRWRGELWAPQGTETRSEMGSKSRGRETLRIYSLVGPISDMTLFSSDDAGTRMG